MDILPQEDRHELSTEQNKERLHGDFDAHSDYWKQEWQRKAAIIHLTALHKW